MNTSVSELVARNLFRLVAAIGRPVGGIRPHRLANYLSQVGYGRRPPREDEYRWYTDRNGLRLKLHPYYLIDREIIAFGAYEIPLQRFISKNIRTGMTCMDVGANMGAMALHLAQKVGAEGRVYAFEPVPSNANKLRVHVAENGLTGRVQVLELALSDTDGVLKLSIAMTSHVNQGMGSLVEVDHVDLTTQIDVKARRLDAFCEEHSINKIDFIKVDIQGAEPLFLKGGQESLLKLRPRIIMEVAPSSLGAGRITSKDLLAQMESCGYQAFKLTKFGNRGGRIDLESCQPDFCAENVLFEPV